MCGGDDNSGEQWTCVDTRTGAERMEHEFTSSSAFEIFSKEPKKTFYAPIIALA